MNNQNAPDPDRTPNWITGQGLGPKLKWHVATPGPLTCLDYSRESGDLFAGDENGTLSRIDPNGQVTAATRLSHPLIGIKWSDDGSRGAVIAGDELVLRLDRDLQVVQKLKLPDACQSIAVSPYGNHLAVGLVNGTTLIFNERKRRIAQFETIRPLLCLSFCNSEPILFGAAEHGLVCCYNLAGAMIWQQTTWSNVGQLCCTGDGDLLYLAGYSHGVQALDGDGASVGSYVLEGTVNRVDSSDQPKRLVVSTVERSLYWLSSTGDLLWGTELPDDVVNVVCDPLGAWAICGLKTQGIYRLDHRSLA